MRSRRVEDSRKFYPLGLGECIHKIVDKGLHGLKELLQQALRKPAGKQESLGFTMIDSASLNPPRKWLNQSMRV